MGQPVRITLGQPRRPEPTGLERWIFIAELAPRGYYFRAEPTVFDARYAAQLDRFADDIDAKLKILNEAFGRISLLCYERRVTGRQCHRLAFGRWWEARTGQEVPELDPGQMSSPATFACPVQHETAK